MDGVYYNVYFLYTVWCRLLPSAFIFENRADRLVLRRTACMWASRLLFWQTGLQQMREPKIYLQKMVLGLRKEFERQLTLHIYNRIMLHQLIRRKISIKPSSYQLGEYRIFIFSSLNLWSPCENSECCSEIFRWRCLGINVKKYIDLFIFQALVLLSLRSGGGTFDNLLIHFLRTLLCYFSWGEYCHYMTEPWWRRLTRESATK